MKLNPFAALRRRIVASLSEDLLLGLAMGDIFSGRKTHVTQENALKSNALLACVIVRAETFSTLPCHVYRRIGEARHAAPDHGVSALVDGYANPLMTSPEFWRWKQITVDIRGKAYARVEWQGTRPVALWPLTNADMKLKYDRGAGALYEYGGDTTTPAGTLLGKNVLHFKGPLLIGPYDADSLVGWAAESIGLSIDIEKFYHRLLQNGSHFPGYLQTDEKLKPEDVTALANQFSEKKGVEEAGEVKIFDRGVKWATNSMSMKDAQLSEEDLSALQKVCRIMRVPPPLVQDWSRSTYTNSEQADMWLAKHTMLPIAVDTEATTGRLFVATGDDKRGYYLKFELNGLQRGDFATRSMGYAALVLAGIMTRQQARAYEDENPIPGLEKPLIPLNMGVLEPDGTITAPAKFISPPSATFVNALQRINQRRRDKGDGPDTLDFAERVFATLTEDYPGFDHIAAAKEAVRW